MRDEGGKPKNLLENGLEVEQERKETSRWKTS